MPDHKTRISGGYDRAAELLDSDYSPADLQVVYRRGHWKNWREIMRWIDERAARDPELPWERADAIRQDLQELEREGIPFTNDPQQVHDLTHKRRRRRVPDY